MTQVERRQIPQNWRNRVQRYCLTGVRCLKSGKAFFTEKGKYEDNDYELEAIFCGIGKVKAVFDHEESGEREVELELQNVLSAPTIKVNLNGLSHSVKIEMNMNFSVFRQKIIEGQEPRYSIRPVISKSSPR